MSGMTDPESILLRTFQIQINTEMNVKTRLNGICKLDNNNPSYTG